MAERGYEYGSGDTIRFGAGIAAADIQVIRDGAHLLLNHSNGSDQLKVENWYTNGNKYRIETVEFADGTVWDVDTVHARGLIVNGTEGSDSLKGLKYHTNTLLGGGGDDTLTAHTHSRHTTLHGGTGTDRMVGSYYEDTYLFNLGDGQDVVAEQGYEYGSGDTIQVGAGIAKEQLWFERAGSDLRISVIGLDDNVTVENWYGSSKYQIEEIETASGAVLSNGQVDQLVQAMASFSAPAAGETTLSGAMENDLLPVIAASWQ